jgi:hypothetical protein
MHACRDSRVALLFRFFRQPPVIHRVDFTSVRPHPTFPISRLPATPSLIISGRLPLPASRVPPLAINHPRTSIRNSTAYRSIQSRFRFLPGRVGETPQYPHGARSAIRATFDLSRATQGHCPNFRRPYEVKVHPFFGSSKTAFLCHPSMSGVAHLP